MRNVLIAAYPWLKALHIVAVISWMVGMLYLPRLYVYHVDVPAGSQRAAMLGIMERRLLRGIVNPAMIATFLLGGLLAATPGVVDWHHGWIWLKLALVLLLGGLHGMLARWRRGFAAGHYPHGSRFFRIVNEVPTIAMIAIVLLVVLKPF